MISLEHFFVMQVTHNATQISGAGNMTSAGEVTETSDAGRAASDDGATATNEGLESSSDVGANNHWIASNGTMPASYWQDSSWRLGAEHGEYAFTGSMDWQGAGWQLPMSTDGSWGSSGMGRQNYSRVKRRFCTSYPDISQCRRGYACAFAHSREEIGVPLLSVAEEQQEAAALTDEFFMLKYKTRWCPIGVQHEWHTCVYAHNYQDARRPVELGYGAKLCPYWSKKDTGAEYSQRCPLGLRCPYSHGAKEQLYHPHYFKTVVCRDLKGKVCPRQKLCAFFHHRNERRPVPAEEVNYQAPLPSDSLPEEWVTEFLSPPFLPETSKQRFEDGQGEGSVMPCMFFLPVGTMMPGQGAGVMGEETTGAVEMNSPMHAASHCVPSSQGMGSQNWVFVPMDGSGTPMPMN
eukprot:TRINITY_DN28787_c0_g1_i1.p1 TRINITY_DN28787_c0_g1~~TRINITY_DN28787_c0_g1_i1.p1  ORF type:complete len:405 (-),score=62.24 TRINITY_DN28787_c0_g1_i1:126-1340(-)